MRLSKFYQISVAMPLLLLGCGGGGDDLSVDYSMINGLEDPLQPYQWHLKNTGSFAFSSVKPTAGIDLNVTPAWEQGITGRGVLVNVIDTGLEIGHPDLARNMSSGDSVNFAGGNDPTNTSVNSGDHGTSVAGLIAMVGGNGIGGKGVAYNAKMMGYNYLNHQTVVNLAKSFGGKADDSSAKAAVFNASWGVPTCKFSPNAQDATFVNVKTLRGGKGALIVKGSGNGFNKQENCSGSLIAGVSTANAAFDQTNTLDHLIMVAAVTASGKKSSYSTTGANIWISGFGGEYGLNANNVSGGISTDYESAMITADQSGCTSGYHTKHATGLNDFERNGSAIQTRLNPKCNYVSTFNGTSSAAPTISGVVALLLQANPNLTWRDVKHILASTARKVDPLIAGLSTPASGNFTPGIVVEQACVTNKAGYNFHNWYGFGLADAGAAVALAKTHVNLSAEQTQVLNPLISGGSASFMAAAGTVETVEFSFNTFGLTLDGCSQIEVTSPLGTKSILINGGSGLSGYLGQAARLLSNAFYGEAALGSWTAEIKNICSNGKPVDLKAPLTTLTIRGR